MKNHWIYSRESNDFDQVVPNPQFPSDQLYLKEFGGESLVLAKEVLKAGTVLGTYKGTVLQDDAENRKTVFKVNRSDGGSPVHVMLEDEGHWIKLMRKATLPTDANICLRISGKDIVCTVTKDVNKEVELKVTCRIADTGDDQEEDQKNSREEIPVSSPALDTAEEEEDSRNSLKDRSSAEEMLDFASDRSSNFEENMTSKNSTEKCFDVSDEKNSRNSRSGDSEMEDADEVSSSTIHDYPSRDEKLRRNIRAKSDEESNNPKSSKPSRKESEQSTEVENEGGSYRCPVCDFTSFERSVCDKHIQSRHSPPRHRTTSNLTNPRAFCEACKIQFMSVNTYQVHKKYYCKSRHESEEMPFAVQPVLESAPGGLSTAFRPSADTVILRGGINGGVTASVIQPQAIYAAISTNPLILLPCSLVSGQGLVPHNGIIPTVGPGIVLQTGLACPTSVEKPVIVKGEESGPLRKTSHPAMNLTNDPGDKKSLNNSKLPPIKRKMSEGDVLNLKKTSISEDIHISVEDKLKPDADKVPMEQESPLDLSLKRKPPDTGCDVPVLKRRNSSASTGRPSPPLRCIRGSVSPPGLTAISSSHGTISPPNTYSSESSPCYSTHVPVVVHRPPQTAADRISPMPPVLQAAASGDKPIPTPGMPPPKLLKQGNNICEECHIVFYKYDNYLAHKKHYCAYRRQQLSALAAAAVAAAAASSHEQSSDDNNSNHSGVNEASQIHQSDDPGKSAIRRLDYAVEHFRPVITKPPPQSVYCCDACGVKFSTQDNLNAHQTYYCIKKADSAMSKAGKKSDGDGQKQLEPHFLGPEEWKCNYCDVSCSSYETIRRHLLTHSELRGFRCLVCGYKGNTLRGMRTHACEHITEDTTSIEEFISSTVITESGGVPIMTRAIDFSDEDSETSRDVKSRERTSSNASDVTKEMSLLKRELLSTSHSTSEDIPNSPRSVENAHKDSVPKRINSIKMESGDSSSDGNSSNHRENVNPLAFCDVMIKVESEQTGNEDEEASRDELLRPAVKFEQESEYDSEDSCSNRKRAISVSPPSQTRSVIRTTSDVEKPENNLSVAHTSKRKNKYQSKPNPEQKYCKSCNISFYHLSNFLAHKKHYCVSRVIKNCLPETTVVQ